MIERSLKLVIVTTVVIELKRAKINCHGRSRQEKGRY